MNLAASTLRDSIGLMTDPSKREKNILNLYSKVGFSLQNNNP